MIRKTIMLLGLATAVAWGANVYADGKGNPGKKGKGGDDFRNTAVEYDGKAQRYRQKGNPDIASVYVRMAAIKRHAAKLADQGRWDNIDWSEYHQLEEKLSGMHNKHKKKYN
ncbi:MAG: hypothetical protein V7739_07985 [Motiliproteus sp.]